MVRQMNLTLADKLNLKDPNTNMALDDLSIYFTWKNKFKISAPIWNDEFDLLNGSYSISDVKVILSM